MPGTGPNSSTSSKDRLSMFRLQGFLRRPPKPDLADEEEAADEVGRRGDELCQRVVDLPATGWAPAPKPSDMATAGPEPQIPLHGDLPLPSELLADWALEPDDRPRDQITPS